MNSMHLLVVAGVMAFGGLCLGNGVQSLFLVGKAQAEQAPPMRAAPTSDFTF